MAIDPDLRYLRKRIDELLRSRRPDRYAVSTGASAEDDDDTDAAEVEADAAWLDEVANEVTHLVPQEEVRRLYARKLVGQREAKATRSANELLRKIGRSGQLVLGWFDMEDDPVSIVWRTYDSSGRPRVRQERVALRAMRAEDFEQFAIEERRRASADFTARNEACTGAEWLAREMRANSSASFHAWADAQDVVDTLPGPLKGAQR